MHSKTSKYENLQQIQVHLLYELTDSFMEKEFGKEAVLKELEVKKNEQFWCCKKSTFTITPNLETEIFSCLDVS